MDLIKGLFILEGIHGCPETIIFVGQELTLLNEPLERFMKQFFTFAHIAKNGFPKNEVSAIDSNVRAADVPNSLDYPTSV